MKTAVNKEKIILYIIASILALAFLMPMVYTILSSVKPLGEITQFPIKWLPNSWDSFRFENFIIPIVQFNFLTYIVNSIIVSVAVTLLSILFCTMAGYGLSKFNFFGRKVVFAMILMTLMIPLEVLFIPMAVITKYLGMMNSYTGLIIPVMITPFGVFWMRQYIMSIPNDYVEAARVDGMNEFQIFFKIIVPLSSSAIGALAIFTFMSNWNSLVWPLIVASKNIYWTIPVGLIAFQSEMGSPLHYIFAMAVVSVAPTLVMFMFVRRQLFSSIAMSGGIKG